MGNNQTKYSKDRPKKNVHWKSAEPPSPPGKPNLAPGSIDTTPDVVTIRWEKPLYDGGSPIIGYLVEHRRTGSPHWVRATPLLVPYSEISLSGLEPGWRYQFRIVAENAVGKSEPSELSDPLTVTLQRNAITAPHFTTELRDTTAIENEKVEFRVNVIGTPPPQINWFKDGFEMFSSRRTKISTENTISSLVIHQAALTDEGEIKCTATNRAGHMVTRARLKLEAPPKIRLPRQYEDGLIIEAEEVVRLKVGVAGRPSPIVIWNHNGEIITNGGRYEITTTEKNSSLKITNTKRSDRGEYQLKAINTLGEDNAFFLVTVTARPEPPLRISITMSLGKSVTLSWMAPDDDGGCKIGNYIVEYFRIGWNVWLKAATTRQLTTTLNDLIEGSEYQFRVKAENPYGLSEPSEESEVLFVPDPKRGITKPGENDNQFEDLKPMLTPRRKNPSSVSSSKSSLDDDKSSKSQRSRNSLNIKLIPQIYDTENFAREMAYGASDAVYTSKSVEPQFNSASNEILLPKDDIEDTIKQDAPKLQSPDTPRDNNDEVHNSSEFVLVLYPDKEPKNEQKRRSFDLALEDAIAPPPLSLSAPELASEPPPAPVLRRAVSSTELLYERAMARFYQAVAFEESEKVRKRSISVIDPEVKPRTRVSSFGESDRRSSLRRRLSGEVPEGFQNTLPTKMTTQSKEEDEEEVTKIEEEKKIIEEKNDEIDEEKDDFDEDYTASTASSDESETEKFKQAVMSASIKKKKVIEDEQGPELETYHPRNMEPRVMSPYRQLDPNQAAEVLVKPMPLPSPDFIPRPILKRPTVDDTSKKNKLTPKSDRKGLKKLFERENKTSSNGKLVNENEPPVAVEINLVNTKTSNVPQADLARQKMIENRQNSIEEEKVVIDHYSDIVKHMGSDRKSTPLYLNPEELKKAAKEADNANYESDEEQFFPNQLHIQAMEEATKSPVPKRMVDRSTRSQMESGRTTPLYVNSKEVFRQPADEPDNINYDSDEYYQKQLNINAMEEATKSPVPKRIVDRPTRSRISSNVNKQIMHKTNELPNQNHSTNLPKRIRTESKERNSSVTRRSDIINTEHEHMPRRRNTSSNRSRSNSAVKNEYVNNIENKSGAPRIRSRNQSQSPAVKNRLHQEINQNYLNKVPVNKQQLFYKNKTSPLSISPEPRTITPEQEQLEVKAELKVRSTMNYITDLTMFLVACWLYIFKDARLAVPILLLMVYRQLGDAIKDKIPKWMKRKKS